MSTSKYIPTRRRQFQLGLAGDFPEQISIYFHQNNLLKLRKALGSQCTYISHVRYPQYEREEYKLKGKPKRTRLVKKESLHYIVAKFENNKPIRAVLNGTPSDIKSEYYSQLRNDLVNAATKKGIIQDS